MNTNVNVRRTALAAALALCFAAPAFAQSTSPQLKDGAAPATTSPSDVLTAPAKGAPAATTPATTSTSRGAADNTNSKTGPGASLNDWVNQHAADHQGRISRSAYMDEAGRRFDAMEKSKQKGITRQAFLDDLDRQWIALDKNNAGLTPAEVSRLTGKVDISHAAVPRTGSDVQAGNMGPQSVKGK